MVFKKKKIVQKGKCQSEIICNFPRQEKNAMGNEKYYFSKHD